MSDLINPFSKILDKSNEVMMFLSSGYLISVFSIIDARFSVISL